MRVLLAGLVLLTLSACGDASDTPAPDAPTAAPDEAAVAVPTSTVTVAYEGRLDDGTVFDASDRATFNLQEVISGFQTGISGMRVGETKTLVIPPEDGYGATPPPGIPPNATLTFDVELLAVR